MAHEIVWVDDDLFMVWSTNTDSPLSWGTRQECLKWVMHYDVRMSLGERESSFYAEKLDLATREQNDRFDRAADRKGSSMFDDDQPTVDRFFIVEQRGTLHGSKLKQFLTTCEVTEVTGKAWNVEYRFDLSLLEPFEDDETGHVRTYEDDERRDNQVGVPPDDERGGS